MKDFLIKLARPRPRVDIGSERFLRLALRSEGSGTSPRQGANASREKLEDVLPRQEPAVAERARRVYSTVSPELEVATPRPLPRKVQDIQTDLGVLEDRVLRKLNRTVAQFAHEPASGQLPEEQRRNRCQPFLQRDPWLHLCLHQ